MKDIFGLEKKNIHLNLPSPNFFFRNSTNSAEVDTPTTIQNALIAKVSKLVFKDKYFKRHHWMAVSDFYYHA